MRTLHGFPMVQRTVTDTRLSGSGPLHLPITDVLSDFLLSYAGGFADTTGFLLAGSFTGHITGNLVLLMTSAAEGRRSGMFRPLAAIGVFLIATVLGLLAKRQSGRTLKWGLLLFQCMLICGLELVSVRLSPWFASALIVVFAICLGLQNGYTGSSDGVTLHVSYMTGTATRWINAMVGLHDSGDGSARTRVLIISSSALLGFASGAISAVVAQKLSAYYAPAFLCVPFLLAAISSNGSER